MLPEDFDLHDLPERIIFQLNDTHPPVIAVPELMRILVDEKKWDWDEAWAVTQKCFAYTCHTLLPEALEVWPVELLGRLLPRHLEIIYRINDDFLAEVAQRFPPATSCACAACRSSPEHPPERSVRMAYLATVAGAKVNGVAELHSQLLRDKVLPDFSEYWPDKFTNVTNGVTPPGGSCAWRTRRCRSSSPTRSAPRVGHGLERLREMEPLADDAEFRERFRAVKAHNKDRLNALLQRRDGITLPADAMLDVMVKRLHEYKRQTLKVLHIVSQYERIVSGELDPPTSIPRRVFAFGAKAAPGYKMAKQIIGLINHVGAVVNTDRACRVRSRSSSRPTTTSRSPRR